MYPEVPERPDAMAAIDDALRAFLWSLWHRRDARTPWARRTAVVLFVALFCAPVVLIMIYRFVPPPFTPLMIGTAIEDGVVYQHWVPIEAISPNLVRAAVASEDEQFCSHHGFDWKEINEAMKHNERGGKLHGASTISQQTAKNLFLVPARNWLRKGIEAYLTVLIEALWPKRRIMEMYLNIAEWGHDRFGAEAAALGYFGKHASQLNAMDAAHLVAVLPNPERWYATGSGPYVSGRADTLVWRMAAVSRDRLDACVYR